jgi:energy-converting hydrogenase Eha subunit F
MVMVWVGQTSTQVLQAMQRLRITVCVFSLVLVMMALAGQLRSHLWQKMQRDMS